MTSCCSAAQSCQSDSLWPQWTAEWQAPLSSTISWTLLKSKSWWCHPTISSSVTLFSSCLQSFPASGSFPVSQLFASGGQNIRASASVLLMNIQGWFPSGLTGLILLSKGLSRIFSSTTILKHQFFSAQPSYSATYQVHFNGLNVWDPAMIF